MRWLSSRWIIIVASSYWIIPVSTYNFTKAISVAIKEFCPDNLVLLGPGNTLGGAVGQILIQNKWDGINSKKSFSKKQLNDTYLISMGINDQCKMVS